MSVNPPRYTHVNLATHGWLGYHFFSSFPPHGVGGWLAGDWPSNYMYLFK